jgi:hypothetical protein
MNTIERINDLAKERARLFRSAGNGRRGDVTVLTKIAIIDQELARLWELRRQERAGRADGIDRLVDVQYERLYGREDVPRVTQKELAELAA